MENNDITKKIKAALFKKRGSPTWREDKLLRPLIAHFEKELKTNPNALAGITPAYSQDELMALHSKYCITDAVIIEETPADTEATQTTTTAKKDTDMSKKIDATEGQHTEETPAEETRQPGELKFDNQDEPIDPMNRQAPKVRDYVLNDSKMQPEGAEKGQTGTTSISEPGNFSEAFKMPDNTMPGDDNKKRQDNTGSGDSGGQKQEKKKEQPFNPSFDDMGKSKQSKQTKRFAKYITELVCLLLERGYEFWVTKDITEVKLMQYELNNEMDLDLLVSLDGVQQQTVKGFFQTQVAQAKIDGQISKDDREELADALADVMMEKGIAPTPTQTLLMTAGKIVVFQGLKAFAASTQINALLNQLREMHNGAGPAQEAEEVKDHINKTASNEETATPQRTRNSAEPSGTFAGKDEVSNEIALLGHGE